MIQTGGSCFGCYDAYNDMDMDGLRDYAVGKFNDGTQSGTYNNNIIIGTKTYCRTVTWTYSSSSNELLMTFTGYEI